MGADGVEEGDFIEEGGVRVEGINVVNEVIEKKSDVAGVFIADVREDGVREVSDVSLSGVGEGGGGVRIGNIDRIFNLFDFS